MVILNRHFKYFGLIGIYFILAEELKWRVYGEVLMVLIYFHSVFGSKDYRKKLRFLCNLMLLSIFVVIKWLIYSRIHPFETIPFVLQLWTILLFAPVLNNLLLILDSPTQTEYY